MANLASVQRLSSAPRCIDCGMPLEIPSRGARLHLFCKNCQSKERDAMEPEAAQANSPVVRGRWPARRVLRLLLFTLAFCLLLIRLLLRL